MQSDAREIRRRCQARLDEIPNSARSLDELRCEVSRLRERPIVLRAMAGIAPLMGLWIAVADVDLIIVAAETSRWHQEHIAAHELAHMLLGHRPRGVEDPSDALFPDLRPETVSGVLQRSAGYDRLEEQEAEVLGTLLVTRLARRARPITGLSGAVLGRLDRFVG